MQPTRFTLKPIPQAKIGVVVSEEPCRLHLGSEIIETRCRAVFRVAEFPSVEIELPHFDIDCDCEERCVSVEFLDSGFTLNEGRLSGIPRTQRGLAYPYRYRLAL